MAHTLEGFIARTEVLRTGAAMLTKAQVVPLSQGFALMPVTEALADEVNGGKERSPAFAQFWRLSERLAQLGASWSALGPVAYVETDYFGGAGEQGPVNWALQRIGARAAGASDAFDTLGLGRHRSTEGWLAETVG